MNTAGTTTHCSRSQPMILCLVLSFVPQTSQSRLIPLLLLLLLDEPRLVFAFPDVLLPLLPVQSVQTHGSLCILHLEIIRGHCDRISSAWCNSTIKTSCVPVLHHSPTLPSTLVSLLRSPSVKLVPLLWDCPSLALDLALQYIINTSLLRQETTPLTWPLQHGRRGGHIGRGPLHMVCQSDCLLWLHLIARIQTAGLQISQLVVRLPTTYRAMLSLLHSHIQQLLRQLLQGWCPPLENTTERFVHGRCLEPASLGDPNTAPSTENK